MNAALIQFWQNLSDKLEAVNKRERWLVFGALLFVVYTITDTLLLSPVTSRLAILKNEITADQAQIQTLQQQLVVLNSQNVIDPDAQNKQRIADLQLNLQQLQAKLSGLQTTLVSPDKMPELLRSLLKKNGKLKLVSLNTLPVSSLVEEVATDKNNIVKASADKATPTKAEQIAYKHGVEITIEGGYLDLLAYVAELEKMPWHILWAKAALTTDQHPPLSQLTLTVYTLSLDQTWLSI